jgi:hypothetical protein
MASLIDMVMISFLRLPPGMNGPARRRHVTTIHDFRAPAQASGSRYGEIVPQAARIGCGCPGPWLAWCAGVAGSISSAAIPARFATSFQEDLP